MYVTMFLGWYTVSTGELRYVNAAHPLPWRIDARGEVTPFGEVSGSMVGILPGRTYEEGRGTLQPGDRLVLYTDGVPEAEGPDEEFLGADGNIGRYLFLLAGAGDTTDLGGLGARLAQGHLLRIASNGAKAPTPPEDPGKATSTASRDVARLRRQVQQRERKLRHLEAQLVKARETQKTT